MTDHEHEYNSHDTMQYKMEWRCKCGELKPEKGMLLIDYDTDESFVVYLDGKNMGEFNHDDHGLSLIHI